MSPLLYYRGRELFWSRPLAEAKEDVVLSFLKILVVCAILVSGLFFLGNAVPIFMGMMFPLILLVLLILIGILLFQGILFAGCITTCLLIAVALLLCMELIPELVHHMHFH